MHPRMRLERLIPDCRITVDGQRLALDADAALIRAEIDLDAELFAQCALLFVDPRMSLMNGALFASGVKVKVELGFGASLRALFEGEVVALEPRFLRDKPPSLRVVCWEGLHRLALSQMTRAFNDADDSQIASAIAQQHGLSAQAPEGTREHVMQSNLSDFQFLRRRAQQHGNQLRLSGNRLVIAPPASDDSDITLQPGDGIKKLKVKVRANQQIGAVSVHGWDPVRKREVSARVEPDGDAGEGAREHGGDRTLSLAAGEVPPDVATAESMARGRMRRLAERFVTADVEMIGDARLVPGKLFSLDKLDDKLDGKYRVDKALHVFDKHGYRLTLKAARVKKKQPPPQQRPRAAEPARQRLYNPRWGRTDLTHGQEVEMLIDAENLEGRDVVFTVEHRKGERWVLVDEVGGVVNGNRASARIPILHPAMQMHAGEPDVDHLLDEHGGTRELRFRVRLATAQGRRPPPPPLSGELRNPRWSATNLTHGDVVSMEVDAAGLEGREVWFAVEHKTGEDQWELFREVCAIARGGLARAEARIEHPAMSAHRAQPGQDHAIDSKGGTRELRFTASLTQRTST